MGTVMDSRLPKGWAREEHIRKSGLSKGKTDIYIKSPNGHIFRSKSELVKYIKEKDLNLKIDEFNFSTSKKIHKKIDISLNSSQTCLNDTTLSQETNTGQEVHVTSVEAQTDNSYNSMLVTDELLGNHWLTDLTLQKYFDILNSRFLSSVNKLCLIVNPLICHAIKHLNEYSHFLESLKINDFETLIMPINDSNQLNGVSGSHWSTLIFTKKQQLSPLRLTG